MANRKEKQVQVMLNDLNGSYDTADTRAMLSRHAIQGPGRPFGTEPQPRSWTVVRRTARRAVTTASAVTERLLAAGASLRRLPTTPDLRAVYRTDQTVEDSPYRERWAHDRVVRSTPAASTAPAPAPGRSMSRTA
ncbi:hypothetical protein SANTM175S_10610 [Streptomyces antimycoticus]